MDLRKIEKTIISHQLVLLFCKFIVIKWEDVFYTQCKLLWLAEKRTSRPFKDYLLDMLLNKKSPRAIRVKFNLIFNDYIQYPWVYEDFIEYCKEQNFFSKFLSDKNSEEELERNKEVIILILGINLSFFRLIPFSITKLKFLKRKKYIAFNFIIDYINDRFFCFNLLEDLAFLKYNLKDSQDLKILGLDVAFLSYILKICNYKRVFKKTRKVNNKLIC